MASQIKKVNKQIRIEYWEKSYRVVVNGIFSVVSFHATVIDDAVLAMLSDGIKFAYRMGRAQGRNDLRKDIKLLLKEE